MTPRRPALRWFGGKWRLAPWILGYFPQHNIYVEPFGGAASVLLRKERSHAEIYNDLEDEIVNLFRVLQDPTDSNRLIRALRLTPFARKEFEEAYPPHIDRVDQARKLLIRSLMGFGSNSSIGTKTTGFRKSSNRSGTTPSTDWASYPESLRAIIDRLRGVVIEHRDALLVMEDHDGPNTLHYVDPPYVHTTRSMRHRESYSFEMSDEDHVRLADLLNGLKGYVVLSGYDNDLYQRLYAGWRCEKTKHVVFGSKPSTETIWLNRRAAEKVQGRLL